LNAKHGKDNLDAEKAYKVANDPTQALPNGEMGIAHYPDAAICKATTMKLIRNDYDVNAKTS